MKMSLLPCLLSRHSQEMYHVYQSMHKNTSIFLYPSSYHLSIYLWEIYLLTKLQHLCTLLFVLRLPVKILFSKVNKVISFIMVMVLIFNLVQFIFLVYLFCFCSPSNLVGFNCLFIWGRGESDERHITVVLRGRAIQNIALKKCHFLLITAILILSLLLFTLYPTASNIMDIQKLWLVFSLLST